MSSTHGELTITRDAPVAIPAKVVTVGDQQSMLLSIISQPDLLAKLDTDKIQALLAMQKELEQQRRRDLFYEALARVQDNAPRIHKDGLMDRGPGKGQIAYATFENIDAHLRPIYKKEGFSVNWDAPRSETMIRVIGRFTAHGHTEEREWSCSPDTSGGKQNPQAAGSTISYGKRYISIGFWNIITEGEDVNGGRREGAEPITQEQADGIATALSDIGAGPGTPNRAAFHKTFGVSKVEEIRVSQFDDVWDRINKRRQA